MHWVARGGERHNGIVTKILRALASCHGLRHVFLVTKKVTN